MKKRNITLTLPPRTMKILDNLYESELINSRTQVVKMALFEWLFKNNLPCEDGGNKNEEM